MMFRVQRPCLDGAAPAPSPEPTSALPGSGSKVRELERRARTRLNLHALGDADEDDTLALQAVKQRNGAPKERDAGMVVVSEKVRPRPPAKQTSRLDDPDPDDEDAPGDETPREEIGTNVAHPLSFAGRLRQLRESRGLSRKGLARRVGVSLRCVTLWERGERRPRWELARQLAGVLRVGLDALAGTDAAGPG
jgi:DNA-binding XRE family transcriptional regulator